MIQTFNQTGLATGDPDVDAFLRDSPTAVLMGILFDQRIRAEVAFSGPYKLLQRLGHFDMTRIAGMEAEAFYEAFTKPPAVHRFSNMMSARTQEFAAVMATKYSGNATGLWEDKPSKELLFSRVRSLNGFGPGKLKKLIPAMTLFGHELL